MGEHEQEPAVDASAATGRQAIYRAVNERMERLFEPVAVAGEQFPIACECGNAGCVEMLAVTDVEYDAVRRSASRFVIQPCHELPGVERVVAANPRFVVVERLDDAGERGAQERDRAT